MRKTVVLLFLLVLFLTGCADYSARKDSSWAQDARSRADYAHELAMLDDEMGIISSFIDGDRNYSDKEVFQAMLTLSGNIQELQSVLKELRGTLKE